MSCLAVAEMWWLKYRKLCLVSYILSRTRISCVYMHVHVFQQIHCKLIYKHRTDKRTIEKLTRSLLRWERGLGQSQAWVWCHQWHLPVEIWSHSVSRDYYRHLGTCHQQHYGRHTSGWPASRWFLLTLTSVSSGSHPQHKTTTGRVVGDSRLSTHRF